MTIAASPSSLQPEDYDEIEAAVMETARGRWFLAEYARRARAAETERLLDALTRIDARLEALGAPPQAEAVPIIERLDALVWKLRESGVEDFVCAKIEALAREIAAGGVMNPPVAAPIAEGEATTKDTVRAESPGATPLPPCRGGLGWGVAESRSDYAPHSPAPQSEDDDAPPNSADASIFRDEPTLLPAIDPRLDALLWLDRLPLLDRLALFA